LGHAFDLRTGNRAPETQKIQGSLKIKKQIVGDQIATFKSLAARGTPRFGMLARGK
jgi:hypothetical protein